MKRLSLPLMFLLAACEGKFPQDRAEACILQTAQKATEQFTTMGGLLQGLTNDPAVSDFDIGAMSFADIKFGTCTETGPDAFDCAVEYAVSFSGDGGAALVDLAKAMGQDLEARRLETWAFRFGPTVTQCNKI